jgi:hypothetical protein
MTSKKDRVQANSPEAANKQIIQKMEKSVQNYANLDQNSITSKISTLYEEWDIERWLEMNAAIFALFGVLLGFFFNPYWLILSMIVLLFLFQHALQGWCPPVPLFRHLGVRTQKEIDQEIYALKFLRGDFDKISENQSKADQAIAAVNK